MIKEPYTSTLMQMKINHEKWLFRPRTPHPLDQKKKLGSPIKGATIFFGKKRGGHKFPKVPR